MIMESIYQPVDIIVHMTNMEPNRIAEMIDWTSHFQQPSRPIYAVPKCHFLRVWNYFVEKDWMLVPTRIEDNVLHLCPRLDYNRHVEEYFATAGNFSVIEQLANGSDNGSPYLSKTIVDLIENTLTKLLRQGKITTEQWFTMTNSDKEMKAFGELIFVANLDEVAMALQPCIIYETSPFSGIVDYLYKILKDRYQRLTATTACHSHALELVKALESYANAGCLDENTLLVSVELDDLERHASHHGMINALRRYLAEYMFGEDTCGLSHSTIIRLADMALRSQYYRHDRTIYRKNRGACAEVPLFRLLTEIFLMYIQSDLYGVFDSPDEIFCRYNDQIVCTWNGDPVIAQTMFTLFMDFHHQLSITYTIGAKIHVLNVEITNQQGRLVTALSRPSPMSLFRLRYFDSQPNKFYQHELRAKLIQAIQLCSDVNGFHSERTNLCQYGLLTGCPVSIIDDAMDEFTLRYTYQSLRASMMDIDPFCRRYMNRKRRLSEL